MWFGKQQQQIQAEFLHIETVKDATKALKYTKVKIVLEHKLLNNYGKIHLEILLLQPNQELGPHKTCRTPEYTHEESREFLEYHWWEQKKLSLSAMIAILPLRLQSREIFKISLYFRVFLFWLFTDTISRVDEVQSYLQARNKTNEQRQLKGWLTSNTGQWTLACSHSLLVKCFAKALMKTAKKHLALRETSVEWIILSTSFPFNHDF